ncbi:MAG: hypothetical protein IPK64_03805 [bacterium]|nr:hypothetical protein [bacterium]
MNRLLDNAGSAPFSRPVPKPAGAAAKAMIVCLAVAAACAGAPAHAAVPQTIAFQGFLTDASAQPVQGTVSLNVAIYAGAGGGTALWSESHAGVAVDRGVFAIVLGSLTPFTPAVARTSPRFLGVRVNGEPELPRTEMRAAPFALRAQASDSVTTGIDLKRGSISVLKTEVNVFGEMNLFWRSEAGERVVQLGPGPFGDGELILESVGGSAEIYSDFNGEPRLGLYGSTAVATIDLTAVGDRAVSFPLAGLNALELANEPGLAAANNTGSVALTATVASIISRTITPPADGYVLALGQGVGRIAHTSGTATSGAVGLSDDGLNFGTAQDVNLQISSNAASGSYSLPVHLNGVFAATAGTPLTIYLVGIESSGVIDIEDTSLTLLYVPTSYGSVSQTLLAAGDGEDLPARAAQSRAEIAAERETSQRADVERLERELVAMRSELTARLAEHEARLEASEERR